MRVCMSLLSAAAVFGVAAISGVNAAQIPLVNAGFETPDVPTSDIVGWSEVDFNADPYRSGTFTSPAAPWGAYSVNNPEGARVGYLDATTSISQNSLHDLTLGEVYTLSAWLGNRLNGAQRKTDLSLYADDGAGGLGALLATIQANDEEVVNGTYELRSVIFDTTDPLNAALVAANLGRDLHVYVGHSQTQSGGGEVEVDDVQLSVVPEPATLSLVAMGALFGLRRRK